MVTALKPSQNGELEISDLKALSKKRELDIEIYGRGTAWMDNGTRDSLLGASQFIQTGEKRQGLKIACSEENALPLGHISRKDLTAIIRDLRAHSYAGYLQSLLDAEVVKTVR